MSIPALDPNIVFFDNNELSHRAVIRNFLSPQESQNITFRNRRVIEVNLVAGALDSSTGNNQLLNSSFYDDDDKFISHEFKPFVDSNDYNGNKIICSFNPKKLPVTYGQKNSNSFFQNIFDEPFEDSVNMEKIEEYFIIDENLKYPRYYNTFFLSGFNGNISVFETIEQIDGTLLTERPVKGIITELLTNGKDARNRSITITNRRNIREIIKEFTIEPFSDEEALDVITGRDILIQNSYQEINKIINGVAVTVLDTSKNASSTSTRLTNRLLYYTEDNANIIPFDDNRSLRFSLVDKIASDDFFSSAGYDNDKFSGGKPESITYRGDED